MLLSTCCLMPSGILFVLFRFEFDEEFVAARAHRFVAVHQFYKSYLALALQLNRIDYIPSVSFYFFCLYPFYRSIALFFSCSV
jgi:hypothetical protein